MSERGAIVLQNEFGNRFKLRQHLCVLFAFLSETRDSCVRATSLGMAFDWVESTVEFFVAHMEYFAAHPLEFARLAATLPTLEQQRMFKSTILSMYGDKILVHLERHQRTFTPHKVASAFHKLLSMDPADETLGNLLLDYQLSSEDTFILESLIHVLRRDTGQPSAGDGRPVTQAQSSPQS
jgi:hypothetical protein